MTRIFVSYSTADGSREAHQLVASLEEAGCPCWIAPRDVDAGTNYPAQIVRAIRASRGLVLLLTPGANDSSSVLQEVENAHNERKPIVPLIVRGTRPSDDLKFFVSVRHQASWTEAKAMAAAVAKVFPAAGPAPRPSTGTDAGGRALAVSSAESWRAMSAHLSGLACSAAIAFLVQLKLAISDIFLVWALVGLTGPLAVWLDGRQSLFVTQHAKQALNFSITNVLLGLLVLALTVYVAQHTDTDGPRDLILVVSAILMHGRWLFFSCKAVIRAYRGDSYRYPTTLRLVR
jgi:uncharacterized Tic20 family protein